MRNTREWDHHPEFVHAPLPLFQLNCGKTGGGTGAVLLEGICVQSPSRNRSNMHSSPLGQFCCIADFYGKDMHIYNTMRICFDHRQEPCLQL
jgi:hypothetical protein